MKKQLYFLGTLCLAGWLTACNSSGSNKDAVEKADSANEKKADRADSSTSMKAVEKETSEFMVKAANGGMMEVELGKIAKEKAQSARVKNFGAMMAVDHARANEELKSLAARKNVTLPSSVGDDERKRIDDLNKKAGKDFDKSYMKMMVDDHEKTVDVFAKDSANDVDPDVKGWSAKTLPVLRKHLDSARTVNRKL